MKFSKIKERPWFLLFGYIWVGFVIGGRDYLVREVDGEKDIAGETGERRKFA
jgi:hypothetical protein